MLVLKKISQLTSQNIKSASGLYIQQEEIYTICDEGYSFFKTNKSYIWQELSWPDAPNLKGTPAEIKKLKPDFECLISSPFAPNELLALPSGSKSNRIIGLSYNPFSLKFSPINLSNLFETISKEVPDLNIEGGIFENSKLILLNRGHQKSSSFLLEFLWPELTLVQKTEIHFDSIQDLQSHGTGLCLWDDKIFALFSAEDTNDSYNDGKVAGSGIVEISRTDFKPIRSEIFNLPVKCEGLARWNASWLVCTDSDGQGPSEFFTFEF